MLKLFPTLLTATLLASTAAVAQTTPGGPSLEVAGFAPQLIAFAGGQANFDNIVNGLSFGSPVTLVSALPNGQVQTVTFAPQGTMGTTQIAQLLESARQSLISRGIGTPTGQQVAISLVGGVLPTQTGVVQVTGLLPVVNRPAAATAAAGAGATAAPGAVTVTTSTPVTITNPSATPGAIPPGQTAVGGTTPPSATPTPGATTSPNATSSAGSTQGGTGSTPAQGTTAGSTGAMAPSGSSGGARSGK